MGENFLLEVCTASFFFSPRLWLPFLCLSFLEKSFAFCLSRRDDGVSSDLFLCWLSWLDPAFLTAEGGGCRVMVERQPVRTRPASARHLAASPAFCFQSCGCWVGIRCQLMHSFTATRERRGRGEIGGSKPCRGQTWEVYGWRTVEISKKP